MLPGRLLRPVASHPPRESGTQQSAPNLSDRVLREPGRHLSACNDDNLVEGKYFFQGMSLRTPAVRRTVGRNFMRYMLLVYLDERALNETEREECYKESTQLTHDLNSTGNYVAAAPLHPVSTATSVRVR